MTAQFFAKIQNRFDDINNQLLTKQIFTLEKLREAYLGVKAEIVKELHSNNEDVHGKDATMAIKTLQNSFKTSL